MPSRISFTNAGAPTNLYGKQLGGDESGLGIANSVLGAHEIDTFNFVQLDLQNLINAGATDALMKIGSVQAGEGYDIFGSSVLGSLGTQLITNGQLDDTLFAVPNYGTYRYLGVRASAMDVLLLALSATSARGCTITIASAPNPAISIVKLTNGTNNDTGTGPVVAVGSTVTWTYKVTNTGNVTLTGVAVTDDKVGAICTIGTLAAGATASCTKTGLAVAGQYTNTGTVTGTPPTGPPVTASNIDHYFAALLPSSVKIEKVGNGPIKIGDIATFTIKVTSLGPGSATDVKVTDRLPAGLTWLDNQDACTIAGGLMSCNIGTMTPGRVFTVVLKARLTAAAFDCNCDNVKHHDGDHCDHEQRKNGHHDGDGCQHEKEAHHHFAGDGDDHEKGRFGHHDGDGCDHDRDTHPVDCRIRNTAMVTASNEDPTKLGDNSSTASIALAGTRHHDGDRCDHEQRKDGHHDGDGCEHEKETHHHFDGDGCDHERRTAGHSSGDGCDHERTKHPERHYKGDGCAHDRGRDGHRDGDGCAHDKDVKRHHAGDGDDHEKGLNGHHDGDGCPHEKELHRHFAGDGDDHEKGRFGHHDGDGCDHDKDDHHVFDNKCVVTRSSDDGDDHDKGRDDHDRGDNRDRDRDRDGGRDRVVKHFSGDGDDHDKRRNGHFRGDHCDHDRTVGS